MAIACEQIRSEFSALLDEELNSEDRELVEEHLSECSDCLRELHGYQQVNDAYRYHHPVKAPEDFEERLRVALDPPKENIYSFSAHWRYAAAAVVLLGVALTGWRLAGPPDEPLLLSKNDAVETDTAVSETGSALLHDLEENVAMDGVEEAEAMQNGLVGSRSSGGGFVGGGSRSSGGGFGGGGSLDAEMAPASESSEMLRQEAVEAMPARKSDGEASTQGLASASEVMSGPVAERAAPQSAPVAAAPAAPAKDAPPMSEAKRGRTSEAALKDATKDATPASLRSRIVHPCRR